MPEPSPRPSLQTPALEVEGLRADYGRFTALADVTFTLPEGRLLALIGPNGAGKTTLVRCLVGLLAPHSGSLRVLGSPAGRHRREDVSYVPQVKRLDRTFPALPLEFVVSGLRGAWPWRISTSERAEAMAALERTGMADVADKPLSELSGGQLQRVFLARGLVRRPRLIFLDEPAAGIDAPAEEDLYRILNEYRRDQGGTVVMVTHDFRVARCHATDAALINRILIAFGSPEEVLGDRPLRAAYSHYGHSLPPGSVDG